MSARVTAPVAACLIVLGALGGLAGCGGKPVVTGRVTYKGEPLPGGEIHFITESGPSRSGVISDDGQFRVEGVPTGTVKVTISSERDEGGGAGGSPLGSPTGAAAKPVVRVSRIPAKYNAVATSGLTFTISGGKQTIDIELTD